MAKLLLYMLHKFICFVFISAVNFVCQIGWDIVTKYLVKHCSGYFHKGIHLNDISTFFFLSFLF